MGTKRIGTREHLLISAACLTVMMAACIPLKTPGTMATVENCNHLSRVDALVGNGDFDGAIKESLDELARSPKSFPGDAALMNLGLISAHYNNPKKDYKKALAYFKRLEREFPQSPLVEEAKIWIGVLQSFEKAKQVDIEIENIKKELRQ